MRISLLLISLASPAMAWDIRTEGGLCIVEHESPALDLVMTLDPTGPLYTLSLTQPQAWDDGPVFSMRFEGARGLSISTTRQVIEDNGQTLSVSDTGFGNVLDGLEFNETAVAQLGTDDIAIDLEGAAPVIEAFRACGITPSA